MLLTPPPCDGSPPASHRLVRRVRVAAAVAGIAVAGAVVAHLVRQLTHAALALLWGDHDPTRVAAALPRWEVGAAIAVALVAAIGLGHHARRWGDPALLAAAHDADDPGAHRGPAWRPAVARATGTIIAGLGLSSLGRESAILESSAALGSIVGRHAVGPTADGPEAGRGERLVTASGVVAGFAAAYHAPVAAVLYGREHLRLERDGATIAAAVSAAALAHLVSTVVLGTEPLVPGTTTSAGELLRLLPVVLLPAVAGGWVFRELRDGVDRWRDRGGRIGRGIGIGVAVIVGAATVAVAPAASGNGLESLRHASVGAGLALAVALGVGKLLATTATIGAGAPGGVFFPTLAVTAGWALGAVLLVEATGVDLPGTRWDAMLLAMVVGVAVGIRSPLVAVVAVPEMVGDLRLVPVAAAVVVAAAAVDHLLDRARPRPDRAAALLHAEDA